MKTLKMLIASCVFTIGIGSQSSLMAAAEQPVPQSAYSTETGRSVHGKLDSRSVATRGLFFTPDLWV